MANDCISMRMRIRTHTRPWMHIELSFEVISNVFDFSDLFIYA